MKADSPSSKKIQIRREKYLKLIPYEEAKNRIANALFSRAVPIELVSIDRARGRVCAEEIKADRYLPDCPLAAMDGYALNSSFTRGVSTTKPLSLILEGYVFPGSRRSSFPLKKGYTCYVATGAPLPPGVDAVARVEEVRLEGNMARIARPVPKWRNVFRTGEDYRKGDVFFHAHRILSPADVGLLMSLGRKSVKVFRTPRVGVLSIGDELTTFGSQRRSSGTRKTVNNYYHLVVGYLAELGAVVDQIDICPDDARAISKSISYALNTCDMLITIGGSSMGVKDLTVRAASSIPGASLLFHGVGIVPIRPTALVMVQKKPVVILPANSISVVTSFFLIALPALNLVSGLSFNDRRVEISAKSATTFENEKQMSALYLVILKKKSKKNGTSETYSFNALEWASNLSYNLSKSNGFVELKKNQKVSRNEELSVTLFGASEMSRVQSIP